MKKKKLKKRFIRVISEEEFREALFKLLDALKNNYFKSVSGPGRSGAIAAVYTSHYLGIPFIPHGRPVRDVFKPHLIIDTATESGKTLRKAFIKAKADGAFAVFQEPPRVKFWYENVVIQEIGTTVSCEKISNKISKN